jgi:hypothetical protein
MGSWNACEPRSDVTLMRVFMSVEDISGICGNTCASKFSHGRAFRVSGMMEHKHLSILSPVTFNKSTSELCSLQLVDSR